MCVGKMVEFEPSHSLPSVGVQLPFSRLKTLPSAWTCCMASARPEKIITENKISGPDWCIVFWVCANSCARLSCGGGIPRLPAPSLSPPWIPGFSNNECMLKTEPHMCWGAGICMLDPRSVVRVYCRPRECWPLLPLCVRVLPPGVWPAERADTQCPPAAGELAWGRGSRCLC